MAAIQGSFKSGTTALTGGTAQTILQIVAPTNQRLKVIGYDLAFDGTNSANTPATVQILRQTTAGTFTNTSVVPVKINDASNVAETLQAYSQTVITTPGTSEPTAGDVLQDFLVPVFGGTVLYSYPPGQEDLVPGGTRLGFKVTAAQSVNVRLTVRYEE